MSGRAAESLGDAAVCDASLKLSIITLVERVMVKRLIGNFVAGAAAANPALYCGSNK